MKSATTPLTQYTAPHPPKLEDWKCNPWHAHSAAHTVSRLWPIHSLDSPKVDLHLHFCFFQTRARAFGSLVTLLER